MADLYMKYKQLYDKGEPFYPMIGPSSLGSSFYPYQTNGGANTAGYARIATIKITATYMNGSIEFKIMRRSSAKAVILTVLFNNANSTDPTLRSFTYDSIAGQYGTAFVAFIYKTGTSTWDVYVQKSEANDWISIEADLPRYSQQKVEITYVDNLLSSIPNDATQATILLPTSSLVDLVYPVGSIYMSVNTTSPQTLFGGTWVKLENRFLLGAGSSYTNGATGGEATHTLTIDEIPSHDHGISDWRAIKGYNTSGKTLSLDGPGYWETKAPLAQGGGQAHNNMPPYLVVNMWKRTA